VPTPVQRDEQMCTRVSVWQGQAGGAHLLARGLCAGQSVRGAGRQLLGRARQYGLLGSPVRPTACLIDSVTVMLVFRAVGALQWRAGSWRRRGGRARKLRAGEVRSAGKLRPPPEVLAGAGTRERERPARLTDDARNHLASLSPPRRPHFSPLARCDASCARRQDLLGHLQQCESCTVACRPRAPLAAQRTRRALRQRAYRRQVPVYECNVNGNHVMRRRADDWINATHILKVAEYDKPARTRILEREVQKGVHEKVQGGYGKYQGTWIPLEEGRHLAERNGVLHKMRPIFDYVPGDRSPPPAPKHATAASNRMKPPKQTAAAAAAARNGKNNVYSLESIQCTEHSSCSVCWFVKC
jgi:hypothetical protein